MSDQKVFMFDRNGDPETGLQLWDPLPAEILDSGSPTQSGHEYYTTTNGKITCGVWDSTPYEEVKGPYPVDEFMVLLEGSLDLETEDGSILNFKAGDSFVVPKGSVIAWKQPEYLRKFYFIHDDAGTVATGTVLQAMLADPNAELPQMTQQDPAMYESEVPRMGWLILYKNPTGKFQAGIWDCSPMKRVATRIERSELMHILEGSGSITNADGIVFNFKAGDTFLVPVGMGYQWQNDEYVKKIFCSYTP